MEESSDAPAYLRCPHYCSHGGRCTSQPPDHEGDHQNGYCTWPSAESIPRWRANQILMARYTGTGQFLAEFDCAVGYLEGDPAVVAPDGTDAFSDPNRVSPYARHLPTEVCDCPNPRAPRPYHCAAQGVQNGRPPDDY